jgi:hypothetical protein
MDGCCSAKRTLSFEAGGFLMQHPLKYKIWLNAGFDNMRKEVGAVANGNDGNVLNPY